MTEQRAHAILSASGSKIWLTCTPAGRFQERFPDQETEFSKEGTWAHSVAAARLGCYLGCPEKEPPGGAFDNAANQEAINAYVRRCIRAIEQAREKTPDALVLLEQRLDYSDWVPEGFGTGDLVIIADNILRVRDLKFGKGVQVDAEDNPQLKLYALGAIAAYKGVYDFTHVVVEIDQPRLNHIDGTEPMPVQDLLDWADQYVKPRAALAWEGEGEWVAGDHCRFCKGRQVCSARAEHVSDLADLAFKEEPMDQLTDDDIAKLLPRVDQFVKWANDLRKYAYEAALKGKHWAGLKLVEGRSNRTITDPAALAEVLQLEGFERALIYELPTPPALLGLTALEKVVGKAKFKELAEGFVKKPAGKPTLVGEDDPRPVFTPSDADTEFQAEE